MALLKLSFTSLFWALLLFVGQVAVEGMSPTSVSAWRFLLAAMLLVPLIHAREGIDWQGMRRNLLPLTVIALVGLGLFNLLLFHGIQTTSAVNASLVMGLCPILITCLTALLTQEPIRLHEGIGLALSLTGATLVICGGSLDALLSFRFHNGDLLVLGAAACWAIYSSLPRRFIPDLPATQITVFTVGLGALVIATCALLTQDDFLTWPGVRVTSAILAMSVFGTVLVFLWWNDGVKRIGPRRAATFMNVVPLLAMLIGLLLGETMSAAQAVGGMLVVGGVGASLGGMPKRSASTAPGPDTAP